MAEQVVALGLYSEGVGFGFRKAYLLTWRSLWSRGLSYLEVCEGIFCVYVVLYVGTGLSTGSSPIHLVLHFAYIIPEQKMLTGLQWLMMNDWMNDGREEGLSVILRIFNVCLTPSKQIFYCASIRSRPFFTNPFHYLINQTFYFSKLYCECFLLPILTV
jgi:hypothetical protein